MFQYIKYKYLGINANDKFEDFISIIDSNFVHEEKVETKDYVHYLLIVTPIIIKVYSNKNLNVVKNFYLYSKYAEERWMMPIKRQELMYHNYSIDVEKYLQEMKKYLLLE